MSEQMELLNPIAKENITGKMVFVDEVNSGMQCDCCCLFCGVPLIARKGQSKTHHFAHQPKEVDSEKPCLPSFERALFWMARTLFEESSSIYLPGLISKYVDLDLKIEKEYKTEGRVVNYNNVEFQETIINKHTDTTVISVENTSLAVQLYYSKSGFHPAGGSYLWKDSYIANLSIDFSNLFNFFGSQRTGFRKEVESQLIGNKGVKSWLYHPRQLVFDAKFEELKRKIIKERPATNMEEARRRFNQKMKQSGYNNN